MTIQVTKAKHVCAEIPEFERLNYFYGQMLGAADFRAEQSYFREKLKLHNRCLHGYGVVCGLEVTAVPEETCCEPADKAEIERIKAELARIGAELDQIKQQLEDPKLEDQQPKELQDKIDALSAQREELRRALESHSGHGGGKHCDDDKKPNIKVIVNCGFALDCHGNELLLRQPVTIDLWSSLKMSEQKRLKEDGTGAVYLSICYCAEPTHPTRPVLPDSCGAISDCNYGKQRDSVRFRVGLEKPVDDERCEPCCAACIDECLLLAKICWEAPGPVDEDDIDNSVRRPISLYVPTAITGISWEHGKTYSPSEAKKVLGTETEMGRTKGIEVSFSRPVHAETLTRGVVELWRLQGGRGLRGMISTIEGRYVDKPDNGLITSFKYRDASGETLNDGDRVLVIIRGDFILDACCRPIDGNHVGGRVPQIAAYANGSNGKQAASEHAHQHGAPTDQAHDKEGSDHNVCDPDGGSPCLLPPGGIGPWKSGNGVVGGTFESWFYID
ncbi:hypothetical protein ACN2CC_26455 [Mesorhizobium muleiense]|uniref:hypothetical protein n=1 Tax=Mesorhizobium muleiense TaxID=1004279 RepID=UPI003AFA1F95